MSNKQLSFFCSNLVSKVQPVVEELYMICDQEIDDVLLNGAEALSMLVENWDTPPEEVWVIAYELNFYDNRDFPKSRASCIGCWRSMMDTGISMKNKYNELDDVDISIFPKSIYSKVMHAIEGLHLWGLAGEQKLSAKQRKKYLKSPEVVSRVEREMDMINQVLKLSKSFELISEGSGEWSFNYFGISKESVLSIQSKKR